RHGADPRHQRRHRFGSFAHEDLGPGRRQWQFECQCRPRPRARHRRRPPLRYDGLGNLEGRPVLGHLDRVEELISDHSSNIAGVRLSARSLLASRPMRYGLLKTFKKADGGTMSGIARAARVPALTAMLLATSFVVGSVTTAAAQDKVINLKISLWVPPA